MSDKKINLLKIESIKISDLIKLLLDNKYLIIKFNLLIFILSIIYALSLENKYRSSSTFYPHYENISETQGLQQLAGLAGVNIDNFRSQDVPPNLYPNLISSTPFKSKILKLNFEYNGVNISYKDYLLLNQKRTFNIKNLIIYALNFSIAIKKLVLYQQKIMI